MDYYGNDPLILKLGHIQGCLDFSARNFGKKMFPRPKSLFDNKMGNPIFGTPFFGTKRSKKI
jgi:hypothetical protein